MGGALRVAGAYWGNEAGDQVAPRASASTSSKLGDHKPRPSAARSTR